VRVLWISKASVTASYRKKIAALARLGVDIGVVTGESWGPWAFEAAPEDDTYTLIKRPQRLQNRNHFHWYPRLDEMLSTFRPDLLHIDEEHYSLVTFQAARAAVKHSIPYLFQTWQNIYKSYPLPFSATERYVFRHAQAALAGTPEIEAVVRRQGFTGPVHIVPLGVDTDLFYPDRSASYRDRFGLTNRWAVGYIGRLVPEKGVLELAEALIPLLTTHADWIWVVAGSGALEPVLQEKVAPVSKQVVILPWLSSQDMAHLMNALDVLVVPSKTTPNWKEQFGRVIIEALAVKLPVVAWDSGAIPEVLGDAGLVLPEGDIERLKNAIESLSTDPDARARLAEKGWWRVRQHFSQLGVAEKLFTIYQSILHT
jgi:glycosyltransferase involved in cell wall biosynthesis